jgi:hypothetical protein
VHLQHGGSHRREELGVQLREPGGDEEGDDFEVGLFGGVLPACQPEGRGKVGVCRDDGEALVDGRRRLDFFVADGVDKLRGAVRALSFLIFIFIF